MKSVISLGASVILFVSETVADGYMLLFAGTAYKSSTGLSQRSLATLAVIMAPRLLRHPLVMGRILQSLAASP